MEKKYITSIGVLECYSNYAISRISVEVVSHDGAKELIKTAYNHFKNKCFVLISDRNNAHQVDSSSYRFINPKKIIGIGLVSQNDKVKEDAMEKQQLYNGAFGFFSTVEEAVDWAKTVI